MASPQNTKRPGFTLVGQGNEKGVAQANRKPLNERKKARDKEALQLQLST